MRTLAVALAFILMLPVAIQGTLAPAMASHVLDDRGTYVRAEIVAHFTDGTKRGVGADAGYPDWLFNLFEGQKQISKFIYTIKMHLPDNYSLTSVAESETSIRAQKQSDGSWINVSPTKNVAVSKLGGGWWQIEQGTVTASQIEAAVGSAGSKVNIELRNSGIANALNSRGNYTSVFVWADIEVKFDVDRRAGGGSTTLPPKPSSPSASGTILVRTCLYFVGGSAGASCPESERVGIQFPQDILVPIGKDWKSVDSIKFEVKLKLDNDLYTLQSSHLNWDLKVRTDAGTIMPVNNIKSSAIRYVPQDRSYTMLTVGSSRIALEEVVFNEKSSEYTLRFMVDGTVTLKDSSGKTVTGTFERVETFYTFKYNEPLPPPPPPPTKRICFVQIGETCVLPEIPDYPTILLAAGALVGIVALVVYATRKKKK